MMAKAQSIPDAAGTNAATVVEAGTATAALPRFKVELMCPTPITHKSLVVEASHGEEAWAKFMAANGISGSEHERRVTPTDEPVTELKK